MTDSEENSPCESCEKIPDEYIQLACKHNFCLECLAYSYLNYLNTMDIIDEKQIVQLPCHICENITELDQQSIETLQKVLQNILDQQEDENSQNQQIHNNSEKALKESFNIDKSNFDQASFDYKKHDIEKLKSQLKSEILKIDVNYYKYQNNQILEEIRQIEYEKKKFIKTINNFVQEINEKMQEKVLKRQQYIQYSRQQFIDQLFNIKQQSKMLKQSKLSPKCQRFILNKN